MRASLLVFALPIVVASGALVRDASACGGCFVQQSDNTEVNGHRMILSVSQDQTTLWDQIQYSGSPASFAWVLPIKGQVTVGLSSDALFNELDQDTQVTVVSPQITCAPPPDCFGSDLTATSTSGTSGAGGGSGGGVTVISDQVVGPYQTVQLSSTDPQALENWLTMNGYDIPSDIEPIISEYVNEQFDFLALKLVPGQGVDKMKPVRVTSMGASPTLPLRMVAAGTGTTTPITLWIMGEGRYEPQNLPSFQIDASQIVWDWDTSSSNYSTLRQQGFDKSAGKAWLIEAGEPTSKYVVQSDLDYLVQFDVMDSGYGDDMTTPSDAETADLTALFGSIPDNSLWITRLGSELSRAALAADLQLQASKDQSIVNRFFQATKSIGTAPTCPTYPPCDDGSGGGFGTSGGSGNGGATNFGGPSTSSTSSCAASGANSDGGASFGFLGMTALAALAAALRKRRR